MTGTETNTNRPGTEAVLARDVRKGDVVLAATMRTATGQLAILEHSDPYVADPQADKPNCQCPGHEALTADERAKPLVVLYDGEIWDFACDVVPADEYVIVKKRDEQADDLPKLTPTKRNGGTFEYNGRTVYVYPQPGAPSKWRVTANGKVLAAMCATRDEAVRRAIRVLDGDTTALTGWALLARALTL
ncbi:hypothetical protein [[Kitasatospora] papulosa]|uniref:hypothetical protein n=1 Tax=[Kitasatospora] papulosa TaxID=1464011 RepID=UPI003685EFE5